jgi:hypothetical protein
VRICSGGSRFGIPALDESRGHAVHWSRRENCSGGREYCQVGREGRGDADASDDWVVEGGGASGLVERFKVADCEGCCIGSLPGFCSSAMVCTPSPPIHVALGFLPAPGADPSIFTAGYLVLVSRPIAARSNPSARARSNSSRRWCVAICSRSQRL